MNSGAQALSVFAAAEQDADAVGLVASERTFSFGVLALHAHAALRACEAEGVFELRDALLGGYDGQGARVGRAARVTVPVAIEATRDLHTVALLHGLIAVGVPFALLHPRLSRAEQEAQVDVVAEAQGGVRPVVIRTPRFLEFLGADEVLPSPLPAHYLGVRDDEAPMAVLFTSGTSGRSKAAVLPRRAFLASARASEANLGFEAEDRWLLSMPLAHVGGLGVFVRMLLARRPPVLVPEGQFTAADWVRYVREYRVTMASMVPTMLARLVRPRESDGIVEPVRAPECLRAILVGGAAAPPGLLREARALGYPVHMSYGLTESCSQHTTQRPGDTDETNGPPLPGFEVKVEGEQVFVRGPNLMLGYLPLEGPQPFDDAGWLPTGDIGAVSETGRVSVFARRSDLIVSGGENVYPAEVERCLLSLEGVEDVAVVGVDDFHWGQVVSAGVVTTRALAEVAEDARAHLSAHRLPRRWLRLESLPLNGTGKLDRRALRARIEAAEADGSGLLLLGGQARSS